MRIHLDNENKNISQMKYKQDKQNKLDSNRAYFQFCPQILNYYELLQVFLDIKSRVTKY